VRRVFALALVVVATVIASGTWFVQSTYLFTPSVTEETGWRRLLPPPPLRGSDADIADMAAVKSYQSQVGSPRWEQAKADISFDVFQAYSVILGPEFTPRHEPDLVELFRYAQFQLNGASTTAKMVFMRPRPYVTDSKLLICSKDAPENTSYPSGHAAWGWLSARILSDLKPAQKVALLARGEDFGLSRVVCGFHYPSDVDAGREMGRIVYDGLQEDSTYKQLFARARRKN
jgi:acid phosphatase (class A)